MSIPLFWKQKSWVVFFEACRWVHIWGHWTKQQWGPFQPWDAVFCVLVLGLGSLGKSCWRTDAFELWCWGRLLRVTWTSRRSNQSILKEITPECSLEGLMLKLKLQYFCHLMRRIDTLEKTLMLGKTDGRRRGQMTGWDGCVASPTRWTWIWAGFKSWWWTGKPGIL